MMVKQPKGPTTTPPPRFQILLKQGMEMRFSMLNKKVVKKLWQDKKRMMFSYLMKEMMFMYMGEDMQQVKGRC
ncbi:unnamed protein product [Urochloa humidicola]